MSRLRVEKGYEKAAKVLDMALAQLQSGKGKERHGDGKPFDKQITFTIVRSEGHGFTRGQALKKIDEAKRLPKDRAINELLGAINYLVADILLTMEEE